MNFKKSCVISLITLIPNEITSSSPFFTQSIHKNINTNSWGISQTTNDKKDDITSFVLQTRGGSVATDLDEEEEVKKPKKKKKKSSEKKKSGKKENKNYDLSTAILTKSSHTLKHTLQVTKCIKDLFYIILTVYSINR